MSFAGFGAQRIMTFECFNIFNFYNRSASKVAACSQFIAHLFSGYFFPLIVSASIQLKAAPR
jgi:ABC-type uncharacterized transport system permease subunit